MITTHKLSIKTPKGTLTVSVDSSQIRIGHGHSHVWLTAHQSRKVLKAYPKGTRGKVTTGDRQYTLFFK
jgi:hypothetical protein